MTPLATAAGYLTYYGYQFNAATRVQLTTRFEYDSSQRTVVYSVHTLRATTIVAEPTPGAGCGTELTDARQKLSHAGQALSYTGGVGGFDINTGGGVYDARYGPTPISLRITPLGDKAAFELEWVVEVRIPDCPDARYTGLAEFAFNVSFSLDGTTGLTTRTVRGHWTIAATRQAGAANSSDTADAYRELVASKLTLPEGFRRQTQDYSLSEDQLREDFYVVDAQLPCNALPPFILRATGSHSVATANQGAQQFVSTISADYTLMPGASYSAAYTAFWTLLRDRAELTASVNQAAQLVSFSIQRGLYENDLTVSFEAAYLLNTTVFGLLESTRIFHPVPNTNWQLWIATVQLAFDVRSTAGLKENAGNAIIDLCGGQPSMSNALAATRDVPETLEQHSMRTVNWVDYQMRVETDIDPKVVVLKTLPTQDQRSFTTAPGMTADMVGQGFGGSLQSLATGDPGAATGSRNLADPAPLAVLSAWLTQPIASPPPVWTGPAVAGDQSIYLGGTNLPPRVDPTGPTRSDKVQARTAPAIEVTLRGYACRIGTRIPCPALASYQDQPAVPIAPQYFAQQVIGQACGVPIFYAEWILKYRIIFDRGA